MAVFYKYQYTNKRKNIHPCPWPLWALLDRHLYCFANHYQADSSNLPVALMGPPADLP